MRIEKGFSPGKFQSLGELNKFSRIEKTIVFRASVAKLLERRFKGGHVVESFLVVKQAADPAFQWRGRGRGC